MSPAPAPAPPSIAAMVDPERLAQMDEIDRVLRERGPLEAADRLVATLSASAQHRALLDALLLKARVELGMPLVAVGSLKDTPEPLRSQYEDRYIDSIRQVGGRLLAGGDIGGAWPYFRVIGETDRVAAALEAYEPEAGDDRLGQMVEIAFNQGGHPRKGFDLILDNYGACSAITAFEHLPLDESIRNACADRLVRHLHEQLTANLRAEISRRGQPMPSDETPVAGLLAGRPWIMADDAYHVDTSHLAATVRMAVILTEHKTLALAVELTDYGRQLSSMHRYESEPPFDKLYEDHAVYFRALLGQGVDAAIAHFEKKASEPDPDGESDTLPAQVLVRLLLRLGRLEKAIDVSSKHLAGLPEGALIVPSLASLCQRAGRADRLALSARERGDLVEYATAILLGAAPKVSEA
jgi:hypothetical protein